MKFRGAGTPSQQATSFRSVRLSRWGWFCGAEIELQPPIAEISGLGTAGSACELVDQARVGWQAIVMAKIPTLETERLRLRPHTPGDLEMCAAMWGDPMVTKYIGGRPFTREEVWARLLRYAGHWEWMGYGFWLMEERESCRFVGEIGLADFKRNVKPALNEGPEAGWVLASESHGKGLATEGLMAVTGWHDARKDGRSISCMIEPANTASIRVAMKCGFKDKRLAVYKSQPTALFVRRSSIGE